MDDGIQIRHIHWSSTVRGQGYPVWSSTKLMAFGSLPSKSLLPAIWTFLTNSACDNPISRSMDFTTAIHTMKVI